MATTPGTTPWYRTPGRLRWLAYLVLIPVALPGCGADPVVTADPGLPPGKSDRWHVLVSGPRSGDGAEQCFIDDAIDEAIQSADFPSTGLGIKLHKEATGEDAGRIADCLRQNLDSGAVSVASPAG